LILTAELGDFDPTKHAPGYVADYRLLPKQTHDMDDQIATLHSALASKSSAEAEFMFLSYAKKSVPIPLNRSDLLSLFNIITSQ